MKRTLSLILAVIMLLGCLSITVFADGTGITIGGVAITDENVKEGGILDNSKFPVIKEGTVTYTAATEEAPAKLTLNNATIDGGNAVAISVSVPLEIELIGDNSVWAEANCAISATGDSLAFSGTGDLLVHSYNETSAIASTNPVTLSDGYQMRGRQYFNTTDIGAMRATEFANGGYSISYGYGPLAAATIAIFKGSPASDGAASGSTSITAIKKALTAPEDEEPEVSYEIVIPKGITLNYTTGNYVTIGTPVVINVDATPNTVISYTVSTTQLINKDDSSKTMPIYYFAYYEELTPTSDPIKVYDKGEYLGTELELAITQEDWYNAAPGTYTASMTFNFAVEEDACQTKLKDSTLYRIGNVYEETVEVGVYVFGNDGNLDTERSCVTTYNRTSGISRISYVIGDVEYKTGDVFHAKGDTVTKCTNPNSHNLPNMSTLPYRNNDLW